MIIFTWAIVGALFGIIVALATKQYTPLLILADILVGVIGSIFAGAISISKFASVSSATSTVNLNSIGYSIFGAVLFLAIKELYRRNAGRY